MNEQQTVVIKCNEQSPPSNSTELFLSNFIASIALILLFIFITIDSSAELDTDPTWESSLDDESYCVAWGDYDNDGDLDLASGNNGPNNIYENENGTLDPEPVWESTDDDDTTVTHEVMWGDIDQNGWLDLVAVNGAWGAGYDVVYLNWGGVVSTTANWTNSNSDHSAGMDLGDFDEDGDLDLATANYNGRECVYENIDGMFTSSPVWESYLNDDGTQDAVFLDVDGDDDLDLYFGCSATMDSLDSNADVMYFNDQGLWGSRRYGVYPDWTASNELWTTTVKAGDIDGDDDPDIIAANGYNNNNLVVMYENTGSTLDNDFSWNIEVNWPYSCDLGDVDQDGWLDVAIASYNEKVYLVRNEEGTLGNDYFWESSDARKSYRCAWGDVDNDTFPELAVANYNTTSTPGNNVVYTNRIMRPTVSIHEPVEGELVKGTVEISGNANRTAEFDLELVEVSIDGGETWDPANGTETWWIQWNTQMLEDGDFTIMARSLAGPLVSDVESVNVTVDNPENRPPEVEILLPGPDGGEADEVFIISWTATDDDPDTLVIDLFYDLDDDPGNGRDSIESSYENTGEYVWDTSGIEEGEYFIGIVVDDNNGSAVELYSEGIVRIEHNEPVGHPPEIEIIYLEVLDHSTMRANWSAWDEDNDDLTIDIYFDDDTVFANGAYSLAEGLENSGSHEFDIAYISPGSGYFLLMVTDEQGESGMVYSELWHLVEHLVPPEFEVMELMVLPAEVEFEDGDGLIIQAVVTNQASVNREGNVSLVIDGSIISMRTEMLRPGKEVTVVFNWIAVQGNHNITVRVEYNTSFIYLSHELSEWISVSSAQPVENKDDDPPYFLLASLLVIAVLISAGFLFVRRTPKYTDTCPQCGNGTTYYKQYGDYYCQTCGEYTSEMDE